MAKWLKKLFGLAAVAGAAAGVFYYLKKRDTDETDEFEEDFEEEDFDLDNDLKPASDREYVPLNAGKADEATAEGEEEKADDKEDQAEEAAGEDKDSQPADDAKEETKE